MECFEKEQLKDKGRNFPVNIAKNIYMNSQ